MWKKNKDDSTEGKQKSPSPCEEPRLQDLQPSMNYPWYDDEGMLDAAIEAFRKIPAQKKKS